ncbi:hypothetical protein J41TS12_23320 [Paenibacillus antibioticophila]|uniref:Uncharacterized protein n=1 Tax=Paenibacillus antibioticophila TaxID=1274374 RepID=A0A919XSA0_9BACL|nr:hypothetical protein [Paenibacillus antibioticophila]GIO37471.1 hypothetical protein J41TS12_23320 [Paenibacillus antibioticophila]
MTVMLYTEKENQKGYFNLPPNKKQENTLLKKEEKSLAQVIIDKIRSDLKEENKQQNK